MLTKFKSFFAAFFALLLPSKSKKYLIGFSFGKIIGFSFVSAVVIWIVFMSSVLLWPHAFLSNKNITTKIKNRIMTSIQYIEEGVVNTIKAMPDFLVYIETSNPNDKKAVKYLRILTPKEPFSIIIFNTNDRCSLENFAHMKYKSFANALIAECGNESMGELLTRIRRSKNYQSLSPIFILKMDTKSHDFFQKKYPAEYKFYVTTYNEKLNSLSFELLDQLYINSLFRVDISSLKVSFSSLDENMARNIHSNDVTFTELFSDTQQHESKILQQKIFNVPIVKSSLLLALNAGIQQGNIAIKSMLNQVLQPAILMNIMPTLLVIGLILLPVMLIATFFPTGPAQFVLFFGFIVASILFALGGIFLGMLLKGTSKNFVDNLKLGIGATLGVFLYRLILFVFVSLGFAVGLIALNSEVMHIIRMVLFNYKLGFIFGSIYMLILKIMALNDINNIVNDSSKSMSISADNKK